MAQQKLSIVYRPTDSIRPDPQNPRLHSKKQVRQIARSLKAFGFIVPVLIDRNGQLITGHGRLLAAQFLEMPEVPTIEVEHLTEAQRRAFIIADNRLTENSEWNDGLLAEQLKTLSVLNLDFSVEVTGFEMKEIDMRIEVLAQDSSGKSDTADAIPESLLKFQVTRSGDLWILGGHRVYCGDARDDSAYSLLMEGRQAKMVFADPPCGEAELQIDRLAESEFIDFLKNVLSRLERNSLDGAFHFICMDCQRPECLIAVARSIYAEFADLCVWVRQDTRQSSLYRNEHELIFVFRKGQIADGNNVRLSQHAGRRTNVWRYRRKNSICPKCVDGRQFAFHASIKPVALIAEAILDCTVNGDLVLDPFLGSGTTVIAAERTGRICYGIELDARHVDLIVRRWQSFTRQNAFQATTGRTFNETEEERGRTDRQGTT